MGLRVLNSKIISFFSILGLAVTGLASCSLAFPEKVSVKTDATYNFCIGEVNKDFNSTFDRSQISVTVGGAASTTLYDYFPAGDNGNVTKYLLAMDLDSFQIDLSAAGLSSFKSALEAAAALDPNASLDLDSTVTGSPVPSSVTTDVDLRVFKTIIDDLGTSIKYNGTLSNDIALESLPMYIYFSSDNFTNLSGNMSFQTESNIGLDLPVSDSLNLQNPPALPADSAETVRIDISKQPASYKNEGITITDKIKLHITVDNLKVKLTAADISKGALNFKIAAYVVLPFEFTVTKSGGIKIDVMALADKKPAAGASNKDKDIFSRDSATDTTDIQKILDMLQSTKINYTSSQLPFYVQNGMDVNVDLDGTGSEFNNDRLSLNGDILEITDLNKLFNTYPLEPSVEFVIPPGKFSIPRNVSFTTNISLSLYMNGEYPLFE